ncbi:hypothetical protein DACRYDRAFT_52218, partial [Dacryopinax primogenitus]
CQLNFHPCILTTAGLKDFEMNEWIFLQQNRTAALFQYASHFHRCMTLHLFWAQWDKDRRAALADFLLKNYQQALCILDDTAPAVHLYQSQTQTSDDQFCQYIVQEQEYFENLQDEPEEERLEFQYLEVLQELAVHE